MKELLLGARFLDLAARLKRTDQISDAAELIWDGKSEPTGPQILWEICKSAAENAEPVIRELERWRNESRLKDIPLN